MTNVYAFNVVSRHNIFYQKNKPTYTYAVRTTHTRKYIVVRIIIGRLCKFFKYN